MQTVTKTGESVTIAKAVMIHNEKNLPREPTQAKTDVQDPRDPVLPDMKKSRSSSVSSGSRSRRSSSEQRSMKSFSPSSHGSPGHGTDRVPPRKRSKVSRACDQCRRKKIRCDAVLNVSTNKPIRTCSNCLKNNDECTFTRIPLKRGPSKGYTKRKNHSGSSGSRTPELPRNSNPLRRAAASVAQSSIGRQPYMTTTLQTPGRQFAPGQPPLPQQMSFTPFTSAQQIILPPYTSLPPPSSSDGQSFTGSVQGQLSTSRQSSLQPSPILKKANSATSSTLGTTHLRARSLIQKDSGSTILPPPITRPRSSSVNSQGSQFSLGNQSMFWKVPGDMPSLISKPSANNSISSSINSTHLTSNRPSSFSRILSGGSPRPFADSPEFGYANPSDTEEDIFNRPARLPRFNFHFPPAPLGSPTGSFTRGSAPASPAASVHSTNSAVGRIALPDLSTGFTTNQQPVSETKLENFYKLLDASVDTFYSRLQQKYPILPRKRIILECIRGVDARDFMPILGIFAQALQILNSLDFNTNFPEVIGAFETVTKLCTCQSMIRRSREAKMLFTTDLVLLNYIVILSGNEFSLGFGIAFSVFKDWRISLEDFSSVNFHNLMHLMILDNCYSIHFGTPRSSSLYYSLTKQFVDAFIKSFVKTERETGTSTTFDMEYLRIGLSLILLSNNLQKDNALIQVHNALDVGSSEYKFLNILRYGAELIAYLHGLPERTSELKLEEIDQFLFEMEYEIFKLCKKLINLIDEQFDDFEIFKVQPLLSVIALKCMRVLKNLRVLLWSIIDMNTMVSKETLNVKIRKLVETIENNISRCLNLRLPNQIIKSNLVNIANQTIEPIRIIKTSANNSVNSISVMKNWCRQTNQFLMASLNHESVNGWRS